MEPLYLSIVIPVYNEELRILESLKKVLVYVNKKMWNVEVLIVDDGSLDRTVEVVSSFAEKHSQFRVIKGDHRGKGYTVRQGMLAAQGEYILFSDADLATPIEEADSLIQCLQQGYDIAIGIREGIRAERHNEPPLRHIMGRIFNLIVQIVAIKGFSDTQCGFKAFHNAVAKDIFSRLVVYGSAAKNVRGASVTAFDVEVLYLALQSNYSIKQVPVHWFYGKDSKVNPIRDSFRMLFGILRVRWNGMRGLYSPGQKTD